MGRKPKLLTCPNCLKQRFVKQTGGKLCSRCHGKESCKKRYGDINKIGKRYGMLTVISEIGTINGKVMWLCKCDCGKLTNQPTSRLKTNRSKSCGCIQHRLHDLSNTPTYKTWTGMIDRCYKPNSISYRLYGAKGITVCDRWKNSFLNFVKDMGLRPEQNSLDRIDGSQGYSKENCRWASLKQQQRNRKKNHLLTAFGKTQTLIEWAEEKSINYDTLCSRIYRGYTPEEALTLEVSWRKKSEKQKTAQP